MIFAVDPGTTESAYVIYDGAVIHGKGKLLNADMARQIGDVARMYSIPRLLAVEMIASYGMPVGAEVFETCVWIGRFLQSWESGINPPEPLLIYRKDIKMNLCGTTKANDGNIRQALIDRLGAPGKKANPGATFGLSGDMWAALAVAVTAHDKLKVGT